MSPKKAVEHETRRTKTRAWGGGGRFAPASAVSLVSAFCRLSSAVFGTNASPSLGLLAFAVGVAFSPSLAAEVWLGTWATAPQAVETKDLPPLPFLRGTVIREVVRVSAGGSRLRLRFSNAYGKAPLEIAEVQIAFSRGGGAIRSESSRAVTFSGEPSVSLAPGAPVLSDAVDFPIASLSELAVTFRLGSRPETATGHPGSRATSYVLQGGRLSAESLEGASAVDRWYFLSNVEVERTDARGAVAALGDSITDGRGSTTNGNDRWPDRLAERLSSHEGTAGVGVLNLGIGGNKVLRDGLGASALARLDRDILAQPGVRWLIVFEGVNDLGGAAQARAKGGAGTSAKDLIDALAQIVERGRSCGLKIYGATITPVGGSFYDVPGTEADRQAVNEWIRSSGRFDAVLDFDAAVRDPNAPARLAGWADSGDKLHLSPAGYKALADAVPLELFER